MAACQLSKDRNHRPAPGSCPFWRPQVPAHPHTHSLRPTRPLRRVSTPPVGAQRKTACLGCDLTQSPTHKQVRPLGDPRRAWEDQPHRPHQMAILISVQESERKACAYVCVWGGVSRKGNESVPTVAKNGSWATYFQTEKQHARPHLK